MATGFPRGIHRRDFLAVSAATAITAAIPGKAESAPAASDLVWKNKQAGMTYRRLGKTNYMVSSIGMGGDDISPTNNDLALWAVDQGLNYFDTAPHYNRGASELGYAAVLKSRGREKIFMTTKVNAHMNRMRLYQDTFKGLPEEEQVRLRARAAELIAERDLENPDNIGPYYNGQEAGLRSAVIANIIAEEGKYKVDRSNLKQLIIDSAEGSLKTLGTDYVDCLLMRDCPTPYDILQYHEVFEAFEQLKKQGKAKYLGFSTHTDSAGVLDAAIQTGVYSMGMFAYNYVNHKLVDPVLEKAKKADFGVLAMKGSRVFQNPFNRRQNIPARVKALEELVPGNDMTLFQKGFHWALQNPNLNGLVIGMTTMEHAKEDVPLAFEKKA